MSFKREETAFVEGVKGIDASNSPLEGVRKKCSMRNIPEVGEMSVSLDLKYKQNQD